MSEAIEKLWHTLMWLEMQLVEQLEVVKERKSDASTVPKGK